jgi:hypothetical protein
MPSPLQIIDPANIIGKFICPHPHCQKSFSDNWRLNRHLDAQACCKPKVTKKDLIDFAKFAKTTMEKQSTTIVSMDALRASTDQRLKEMEDKIAQLAMGHMVPAVNNQNLNILCLGSKDNLLDILASSDGLPNALSYLKGCALARLSGDCRILERVYKLDTAQAAIMYANKSKTKFVYYDERQRRTVESNKEVMAKKLADILQLSYLKRMGSFRTDILDNQRDDYRESLELVNMPELAPYDLQIWNAHIHELADENYQKKVLKNLKIPTEPPRE